MPEPIYAEKYYFEPICDFPGVPKWLQESPLGLQKSAKGAVAFLEQFRLIGTGADLVPTGCDLASIWLQGRIFLDFGMVFGRFWDGFWDDFGRIFNEFWDRFLMKIQ